MVVARIEVLLFPVASGIRLPDPTPLLQPRYGPSSLLRVGPPSAPHRYARLAVFAAWASPFTSERLVPAVPRNSLHPLHAPSTPIAVRPVIRHPADLSQVNHTLLVSTTLKFLTTRLRRVHFRSSLGRSPARVFSRFSSNAHHHGSLPQRLGGGLRPAPESRSQGALPHLSRSLSTRLISS